MRKILAAAALASALVACKGAQVRPTAKREFTNLEVSNCFKNARNIDTTFAELEAKPAKVSVFMYVDADGAVPAAFIHDMQDSNSAFNACLLDTAIESKFDPEGTDYVRPEPVRVAKPREGAPVPSIQQLHTQPPAENVDEKVAQGSLVFAGWATATDKGWGYLLVHDYAKSIEQFRAAIAAKADDARAQRGLALALVGSGGDVKEARTAADAAVKAQPDSVAAYEALVQVCLAQKDDKCVLDSWERATVGEVGADGKVTKPVDPAQKTARSYQLSLIQDQVKAVHARYGAEAEKQSQEAAQKAQAAAQKAADPTGCGKFPEGDERTMCFVKYCFAAGAETYARSLKPLTGADYKAGEWKVAKAKSGASDVTVQIRAKKGHQPHDATWQVAVGDNVDMKPLTIDANNISKQYNACAAK